MAQITSISIDSNDICFGPMPEPTDEVEQHLTIYANGKVALKRYAYGDGDPYKLIATEETKMLPDDVSRLMEYIDIFLEGENPAFATDVGTWTLTVRYGRKVKKLSGSMIGGVVAGSVDLTSYIRSHIDIDELMVFGGGSEVGEEEDVVW